MADKVKCLINGKAVSLSPAAVKIAKRFYGAVTEEELKAAKPVELQKPLIKPTIKPIIIKPPLKEVPGPKVEGDPAAEEVKANEPDITGDPVTEKPVKKAPVKRKKK